MVKEIANPSYLSQILDDTFPLWGNGLSRQAYATWNRAQGLTPWGRQHLTRMGILSDGRVVASAKRYVFDATIEGRSVKALGIGAVFTAPQDRGQGLAAALIEGLCEDGRAQGCELALLFSEIGPDFYQKQGFSVVPRTLLTIDVPRNRLGAPATLVRAGEPADLPELADISLRYSAGSGLALQRSSGLIEFFVTRRRLLAGLGPSGVRSLEFFVSEEGHRAVAYVVISRGPKGVWLQECGDRDPAGARVGAMLEVLAAREPSHEDRTLRTWWPETFRPPQIQVVREENAPEIMMVRSLTGGEAHYTQAVYWQNDMF